ncbi:MAG: glycosyltransferase family 2 protein [Desulfobacterales bacterium]|nr:glycosyltransferase family 2 protein [Desulfobacterales bacterium]
MKQYHNLQNDTQKNLYKFSLVMTNYNNGCFIDEAIQSVIGQTFTDWELIIVDDASTDDSLERIKKYLDDPRIRLYVMDKNQGYTKSQIFGFSKVASDIVGILDSDDALLPQAIEKVYSVYIERPELGLVLTQMVICDSSLLPVFNTINTQEHLREPMLWQRGVTHFRTFRLSAYKRAAALDENLKSACDMDLIFKIEEVAPVFRIDMPLIKYRNTSNSLSHASHKYHVSNREAAILIYRAYIRRRYTMVPNVPRAWVLAWITTAVRYSLELGQRIQAIVFALRGLRIALEPASFRALMNAVWGLVYLKPGLKRKNQRDRKFFSVRGFQNATGNKYPDCVCCIPLFHKRGHALFGDDYLILADGFYRVIFELKIKAYSFAENPLLVLDIYENLRTKKVLAEQLITLSDVGQGHRCCEYGVEFEAKEGYRVEFRVYWAEQCFLTIYGVALEYMGKNA